jgi:hypothetical protein
MTPDVDTTKPIAVFDFLRRADAAGYVRHQDLHPERYEIILRGVKYTVGADNILLGPTDSNSSLIDRFEVRNVDA